MCTFRSLQHQHWLVNVVTRLFAAAFIRICRLWRPLSQTFNYISFDVKRLDFDCCVCVCVCERGILFVWENVLKCFSFLPAYAYVETCHQGALRELLFLYDQGQGFLGKTKTFQLAEIFVTWHWLEIYITNNKSTNSPLIRKKKKHSPL